MPDNDECKEYNSTGHLSCELCINSPEMATALETIDSLHSGQCDKERFEENNSEKKRISRATLIVNGGGQIISYSN